MLKAKNKDVLAKLLESKEARAAHILELAARKEGAVVTLTVNWPGPEKDSPKARLIHSAGVEALREAFSGRIVYEEMRELATGNEAYFIVSGGARAVKAATCEIEDTHPLGRLFDIDVFGEAPISRTELGYTQRRCMVCGGETLVCRRQGRHTLEELEGCIDEMLTGWFPPEGVH